MNIVELVDVALEINYAQGFDLNFDVAPPTIKRNDAKRHTSLLYNFLLEHSLHFGVNEIYSFKKIL